MARWFPELTEADVARLNAKARASRVHRVTDTGVHESREPETPQNAPERSKAGGRRDYHTSQPPETHPDPVSGQNPAIAKAQAPLQIRLPWPPTVNHYWLSGKNGHRYISAEGLSFRARVKMLAHGMSLTKGAVGVTIIAYPPDNRRRDLDNILKACLDALQHAGLIEDDSNVQCLLVRRDSRVHGGAVAVEITGC